MANYPMKISDQGAMMITVDSWNDRIQLHTSCSVSNRSFMTETDENIRSRTTVMKTKAVKLLHH